MKENKSLIKIEDIEEEINDTYIDYDDYEDFIDDYDDYEEYDEIEDLTDEVEIHYENDNEEEVKFEKGIKKKRKDNLLYTTKIKIKDHLDEKIYPKNKLVKKISNIDTYEKIYDGIENTIKVASKVTSKNIKVCVKTSKKTINFLSNKKNNISKDLKRNIDGEIHVMPKTIDSMNGEKVLVDIIIKKYWNEKCIKNLDQQKVVSLIEKIKLNKDEPYFIIKIRTRDRIREIKIEKWSYDELIHKLNNTLK